MVMAGVMMGGGAASYSRQKSLTNLIGGIVFGSVFAVAGSFKSPILLSFSDLFFNRFNVRHGSERFGHILGTIGGLSLAAYSARRTLVRNSPFESFKK